MATTLNFGPYCLKRGTRVLADGVSFAISPGNLIELVGDNGTGKTSLLNVLAGIADPRDRYARWSQDIGRFYFAQASGFHLEWSVEQQLVQSLALYGVRLDNETRLAYLARVGLKRHALALVKTLSHGQQRRLLLAIMQASNQPLWLIDEPLNALDASARQLFCDCLIQHLSQGGMAIVATHQSLLQVDCTLSQWLAGTVQIQDRTSVFQAHAEHSSPTVTSSLVRSQFGREFLTLIQREMALLASRPADMVWPLVFFLMLATLFPFASGAGRDALLTLGIPVMWMATLLSLLMSLGRAFDEESRNGALVQYRVAGWGFQSLALAKLMFLTLIIGLPLGGLSLLVSQLYHLPLAQSLGLGISILAGVPILLGLGLFFSSLALLSRQAHLMTNLLALPLYVPVLIFGTTVALRATDAHVFAAPMAVLLGLDALTFLLFPWLIAKAIHLAIE